MRKHLFQMIVCSFLLILSIITSAQETTAVFGGLVSDNKGAAVGGATVSIKHVPTGYVTTTQTNKKGSFSIPNLKVGGPYEVKISFVGFKDETYNDVTLNLGNNADLAVALQPASIELKEVVVAASGRKTIAGANTVGLRQIITLPSIGRSLSDFTRLTPQSNNNSYAGSNFRYNNLTVDGAINNDAIGFSNSFGGQSGGGQSGAAGAGTRTNPYSLDAIQEVQVQLAPYDVKLGNFTGGSVNAVTKSGTNDFHGSLYAYGRNQSTVGKSVDGKKTKIGSDFYDYQYGVSVGGPILKNKIFFFVNYEQTRRQEPTFYNIGDPGTPITETDAKNIQSQFAKRGFDAGSYAKQKIFTNSDKFFGRLDFNINKKNTLMLRVINTNGSGNNIERTNTNFQFSSTDFTQYTKNTNIVAELKTKISNSISNQFNASYINVHEYRTYPGTLSPFVDIASTTVWAGTWREASIYNMKQQTIEISDNLTYQTGINKFTLGTHNEIYNLTYGFINSWNGRWEYSNLTNFYADKPSRIRAAYYSDLAKNDRNKIYNNPPNPYGVNLTSLYFQDEIAASKRFKITPGIRVDYPFLNSQPSKDSALSKIKDYSASNTFDHTPFAKLTNKWLGTPTFSPRLGFNFDVRGDQTLVIRGGSGVFVGRMPFAWLGYAETLTGNTYGNIDFRPSATNTVGGNVVLPLSSPYTLKSTIDARALPSANATNKREVDLIDNNFKLPSILRSNIAVDVKFGKGYKFTWDVMYTKTLYDVQFQQINLKDSIDKKSYASGPTQSPVYVGGSWYPYYTSAFFLKNTTKGYRYNFTVQLSKFTNNIKLDSKRTLNFNWSTGYTYGVSKDISNGIRNSFQSNYELNPAKNAENPELANSNFDLRHRIVGTLGGNVVWNALNSTSLVFFYAGQSGNPYTIVYAASGTPFGNNSNANLPYIPTSAYDPSQINFAAYKDASGVTHSIAEQQAGFENFIKNDSYLKTRRGQYAERNALHTPWNHELDFKLMHEFKFNTKSKQSLQVSFDMFNLLNLINNEWGRVYFATNVNNYTFGVLQFVADAKGKAVGTPTSGYTPTFNYLAPSSTGPTANHFYTVDPVNSRWQGQFGIKYNF